MNTIDGMGFKKRENAKINRPSPARTHLKIAATVAHALSNSAVKFLPMALYSHHLSHNCLLTHLNTK